MDLGIRSKSLVLSKQQGQIFTSTYLRSPILTLLESLETVNNLYLHDIIHAYDVLLVRITALPSALLTKEGELPALKFLRNHSHELTMCLRRDIGQARSFVLPKVQHTVNQIPDIIPPSLPHQSELILENSQHASIMSHTILGFLSSVFRHPLVLNLFSTEDIAALADTVITLALDETFPHEQKIGTFVVLLLVHNLPVKIIEQQKTQLARLLNHKVTDEIVSAHEEGFVIDCMKIAKNLLTKCPAIFLPVFYELLPIIQAQLTSQNRDIQLGAAHALGGFAVAVTSSFCPADLRRTIAKGACDFVDSQVSTQFRDEEYHAPRFPSLIRAALSQVADRSISRPCWALSVISSLVVLSDGLVYTRPHFLRFVVNALAHTLVDKRADVRALDLQAWKCLIWAMMRLRCEGDRDESPTEIGTFDKVFVMLKQELRCGIGLSLVYCLAGDHPSPTEIGSSCASGGRSDLSRALEVICDMAKHTSTKLHTEGISLMAKMSNGIGTSSSDEGLPGRPWDIGRVLEGSLFDGVALGADNAKTALQLTSVLGLDDVRCLSEDEIAKHWDDILMIWNIGIRRAVQARKFLSFSDDLLNIWHALLLVQTHPTQDHAHLTASREFADKTVAIITDVLSMTCEGTEGDSSAHDTHSVRLHTVLQLWAVAKNVFTRTWLTESARSLLGAVFKYPFPLGVDEVKATWSVLCSDLALLGAPDLLSTILISSGNHRTTSIQRQMWTILAENWSSSRDRISWKHMASFLSIPMRSWRSSQYEQELWSNLLQILLSPSSEDGVPPNAVIAKIMEYLPSALTNETIRMEIKLLGFIQVEHQDGIPLSILSHIDHLLSSLYSLPELLYSAIDIIKELTKITMACPVPNLEQLLHALSKSFCIWTCDDMQQLLEEEYNNVVMPLYCGSLERLCSITPSTSMLHQLEPFFCSAFHRVPPPALGPLAFKSFWGFLRDRIGPENLQVSRPESIKACLTAFYDACGEQPPYELASKSQAQSYPNVSSDVVPDSQPHVTDPTIYGFHPLEDYKSDYGNDTLPVDVNHDKFSVLADSATTAGIKKTLPDRSRSFSLQEYSQEGSIFNDQAHCDFVAVVDEQPLSPEVPLLGLSQSRSLPRGNPRPMLGTCRAVSIPDASFSIHIPSSPLTKKSIPKDKYSKRPRNDEGPGHQHDPCCDDDAVFQAQHEDLSAESSHRHKATSFLESQKCRDTDACTRRSHKRSRTSTPSQDIQQPSYELVLNEPGPSKFQDTSSDDYDTWEATVATPEVLRLRKELTSQNCDDTVDADLADSPCVRDARSLVGGFTTEDPSPGLHPHRSQSAPVNPIQQRPSLLLRGQTSSSHIKALENAYNAAREAGMDMSVNEVIAAIRLAHQIQGALSEELLTRLELGSMNAGKETL